MYKALSALAILGIVSGTGAALADDSGHASINSLKWQMRHQIRHMHRFSDSLTPRYASSISNQTGCPTNFGAYGCTYWAQ
jgi:hypothetical protein